MNSLNLEMDHLDQLAAEAFPGYLVRKDLVRRYARQYPVPTYVVEFLLGRYCASVEDEEIREGLVIVEKQLEGRTVRPNDQEVFKSRARENGSVKLIDIVRARLDARNDCYVAELPSLGLSGIDVGDSLVKDNQRMLTDGFYAEVTLEYDAVVAVDGRANPFRIASLRPIQMSEPRVLDVFASGRGHFTTGEWCDFLIRSVGLEPGRWTIGRSAWPYSEWSRSWSGTTTLWNSALAARGRATSTSRSRRTRTCSRAARRRSPRCS